MGISLFGVLKGLLVQEESDRSKQVSLEVDSGATTSTKTTITAAQTANRSVNLPDADTNLIGDDTTDTVSNKTLDNSNSITVQDANFTVQDDGDNTKQANFDLANVTTSTTRTYTMPDADTNIMGDDTTNTVTNKSIDADNNTITNIDDNEIKASAGIDATKIADGTVTDTEFQYINTLSSNVQDQLDAKLDDFSSTNDNRIVRTDGTSGDAIQESGITVDDSDNITGVNDLTVGGDLTVNGTTTTIDTTNLDVEDANITVNNGGNDASSEGAGITVERTSTDGSFVYEDALTSKFKLGASGSEVEVADVSSSQVFTNKDYDGGTASDTSRFTLSQADTSTLEGLTRKEGTVFYDTDRDNIVYDDGSNILPLESSGGSGSKNYLDGFNDFESSADLNDVSTYDDGGAYVDGTGGSPSVISTSRTTAASEVLEGNASLQISKSAADGSGEGVTLLSRSLDRADAGRRLFGSVEVDATDANYTSEDLELKAYDVTNARELVVQNDDDGKIRNQKGKINFTIDGTDSSTTTIRLSLHLESDSDSGSSWDVFVDEPKLGPAAKAETAIITQWESFTPTGSWTTNTTYTGNKRRVGDNMEVQIKIALSGAPDNAQLSIDIPDGLSIDTSKFSNDTEDATLGLATYFDNNAATITSAGQRVRYRGAATEVQVSSGDTLYDQTNPITWAASDEIYIKFSVPIEGWSSGALLSTTETAISPIKVIATTSGGTFDFTTAITYDNEELDSHNAFDHTTGEFTAPKAGVYLVSSNYQQTSANTAVLAIKVNGTRIRSGVQGTNTVSKLITAMIELEVGDVVTLHPTTSVTLESFDYVNYLSIMEVPDFSVFGVTGEFEVINSTSSELTPGGSSVWHNFTDNSIDLTPGTWELNGSGIANNNGSTPEYALIRTQWSEEDGDGTSTVPSVIQNNSNITLLAGRNESGVGLENNHNTNELVRVSTNAESIIVRVTATTTIYLTALTAQNNNSNARITVNLNAKRLQ